MSSAHSSDIPYEPVDEDFPIEDKHYTLAEIWWRLHNNKILGWIIVCLVLVISYVLICNLPAFHSGIKEQKKPSFEIMSGIVLAGTRNPPTTENSRADQDIRTNGTKYPSTSKVTNLTEEANPTIVSDKPSTTSIDQTITPHHSSLENHSPHNAIHKPRLPPTSSGNIENDAAFQMSANRVNTN